MDHLGKFLNFFISCIAIANEKLQEGFTQMLNYRKYVDKLVNKIEDVTMEQLNIFTLLDVKASSTIAQFLNCLEALMLHCCHDLSCNVNIDRIIMLFKKHQTITTEALKLQENCKKSTKKGKNQTIEPVGPKVELNLECVWDLKSVGNFTVLIFEDNLNEKVNELKQNENFVRFVLNSMSKKILQLTSAPEYLKVKHSKAIFGSLKKYVSIAYKHMHYESFRKLYEQFDAESAVALTECFKNAITAMDVAFNTPLKWQEFLQNVTNTQNTVDWMVYELIKTIQRIIEWAYDGEKDIHLDQDGEKIVFNLFVTMETLFKNFQKIPNTYSRDAYNWLLTFCKNTDIDQKNLCMINKVLFQIMEQQDKSNTMMEHIACKISNIYGHLEEEDELEESSQHNLKSISIATVDQSFSYFANILKKQIENVEFCILRMNSYNAHIKIPGQDSRNESINALQSLEKSCVIKMTHLGKVIARLCNSRFNTRGGQIETLGKVTINYFVCLGNLMKHFCQHFDIKKLNFQLIALETLMKETKITVKSIYALAQYIDDMIDEEQKKAQRENKKKSAGKEFKYMSRLVYNVEKFSEKIQKFDQLTKKNFSKFIHTGDVRDLRIKVRNHRETDSIDMETSDTENSDEDVVEKVPKRLQQKRTIASSSDEEATVDSDETNASLEVLQRVQPDGFIKNVQNIARKTRKHTSKR